MSTPNHGEACTVLSSIGPIPKFGTRTTFIAESPMGAGLVAHTGPGGFVVADDHIAMYPNAAPSKGQQAIWVRAVRAGHDGES